MAPKVVHPKKVKLATYQCQECNLKMFQFYQGPYAPNGCPGDGIESCQGDLKLFDGPITYVRGVKS